jgi:membrane protein DedA with SNARE-associated domain
MDSEALDWLIQHGYIIMFLVMLVEGPVTTATASLGAALGYFNVYLVFTLSFLANLLPDLLFYGLGRWGGQRTLDKYGERMGIARNRRDRAARFIDRNLAVWLFFIKPVPFVGLLGLAITGALGISLRRFLWWDGILVALGTLFFVVLGYYSGKGYEFLGPGTRYGYLALAGAVVLFLVAAHLFGRMRRRLSSRMRGLTAEEVPAGGE